MIQTERLLLREFSDDDFDAVHAYASDIDVVRYMPWGPNSELETAAFLDHVLEGSEANPRTLFEFAVEVRDDGRVVGGIGLDRGSPESWNAMLGYCFDKSAWGRGYATEAAMAMIRFGFVDLNLHRMQAACDAENAASARVLEKAGMAREGHLRHSSWIRGAWRDDFLYGIVVDDWEGV